MISSSISQCFVLLTLFGAIHCTLTSQSTYSVVHQNEESCPVLLEPDPLTIASPNFQSTLTTNSLRKTVKYTRSNATNRTNSHSTLFSVFRQTPRIIGGDVVVSKRLREMMAFFVDFELPGSCSGTLISPTWVLTAAHCQFIPRFSRVIIGSSSLTAEVDDLIFPSTITVDFEDGEILNVRRVIAHPNFDENFLSPEGSANDIALVELSEPSSSTSFMRLNTELDQPKVGSIARNMGFGFTSPIQSERKRDASLRQVDLPIFSNQGCREFFNEFFVPDKHVCAGYKTRFCSSCFGDSGGPLFQYDIDDNPVHLALVSFGKIYCGEFFDPGVYVRTAVFIDWISEQGVVFSTGKELNSVIIEESILEESVEASPGLDVDGDIEASPGLDIDGDIEASPGLDIDGDIEASPGLDIDGDIEASPGLDIDGDIEASPGLDIDGDIEASPGLDIDGDIEASPGLDIDGDIEASPGLDIDGDIEPSPGMDIDGDIEPSPGMEEGNEAGSGNSNNSTNNGAEGGVAGFPPSVTTGENESDSDSATIFGVVAGVLALIVVAAVGSVWAGKRNRARTNVLPE